MLNRCILQHCSIFLRRSLQETIRRCNTNTGSRTFSNMVGSRQLLLISSSKVHGYEYMECAAADVNLLLRENNVSSILFIPYALKDHDSYLAKVESVFSRWGYTVHGIHKQENPVHAVELAEAIFIGGGNTFQLLKTLYEKNLIKIIRKRVLQDGVPYIGSSAGTNVATRSISTTNDMPIVFPPSFEALNLVPFNINPHYLDHDVNSTHNGETREDRIVQYLETEDAGPVLALREGSSLYVKGNSIILKGTTKARLFIPHKETKEYEPGSDLSFLLMEPTLQKFINPSS